MSHIFQEFLQENGIISHRSYPSTPQQNGVGKEKLITFLMLSVCFS